MSEKTKLKIGEFSKLMQVTVKTLRHYEQMGLLIPYEVDKWTGYRYYTIERCRGLMPYASSRAWDSRWRR